MTNHKIIKILEIIEEDIGTEIKLGINSYRKIFELFIPYENKPKSNLKYDLKSIRMKYDLTQEQFAHEIKINRGLIAQIETGKYKISENIAHKIEKFLNEKDGN